MEKFELTDFSGGQQERFSAADFKPNEWARLRGFVIEDARTIRSQWGIQEIGYWGDVSIFDDIANANDLDRTSPGDAFYTTRVQSIAGLSTNSGVDYLFGWLFVPPNSGYYAASGVWRLVYKAVSSKNTEPNVVTKSVFSEAFGIQYPTQVYTEYWKDVTLDSNTTDWQYVQKSDGSIVQYGADDGTNVVEHTEGPRFICNVPYYGSSGVATTGILTSCGALGAETKSYLVYEGTGYNGSPFVVKEYTNYLPTATADTDANGDGVLDNGGALIVSSNVMPRATVGTYWRGQLILGDVEYFTNPKELEEAYNDAYSYYTGVYRDWLNARTEYKRANGQAASYPITAPSAIATLQLDRGLAYVQAYKTYIVAWKAKFEENKATSSNVGFPTAPSTGNYAAGSVKRYKNGIWFSQPGTIDQFHPFAFTADVCPPDAQIVGFVPVEDGLLVITTSNTKDAVILLRGNSFGYMSDEGAVINVRVETVPGAIGSKYIDSALAPHRSCYWSKNSSAVYIGRDGSVQITNGSQVLRADTFRAVEPILNEAPTEYMSLALENTLATITTSGHLPVYDQVYAFKDYIFLSRGFRWYIMTQLEDNSFAWSELRYPTDTEYIGAPSSGIAKAMNIAPKHMVDVGGNLYFISFRGGVYRLHMSELEADLSSTRGSIQTNDLSNLAIVYTVARSNGVATVGLSSTSGFSIGQKIHVNGLGTNYDGLKTVTAVLSSPPRIQFSCASGTETPATTTTTTRLKSTTTATVGVASTSGFAVGDSIYVDNLGASYDGLRTITLILSSPPRIQFSATGPAETTTTDTDGTVTKSTDSGRILRASSPVYYPELTISTQTLQGNDYYEKSFWHRIGVRVKQVYNGASGTLVRIVTRNAPAKATTSVSHTTTLNSAITERGEVVAPTHGPSVEFSADVVFTGDVSVEGVTVYKHGRTPRRQ